MKKNICIIVLLLCVIGLGGYLSYDKFFKEEKEVENNYKDYKNIVNILEGTSGGGSYAMFIDIDGNINIG